MPTAIASSRVSTPDDGAGDDVRLAGRPAARRRGRRPGPDHLPPRVHRPTGGEHVGRVDVVAPGAGEHLPGQRDGQLDDVGRAAAGEHLDRLPHLERVAGGQARAAWTCR